MITIFLSVAIGLVLGFIFQLFRHKMHLNEILVVTILSIFIGLALSICLIPKQFSYKYELLNLSTITIDSTTVYTVETNGLINTICKSNNRLMLYSFNKENTSIVKTKGKSFVFIKRKIFKQSIWYLSENENIVKTIIFINNVN